jgi:phospholipase/carboxylesterase
MIVLPLLLALLAAGPSSSARPELVEGRSPAAPVVLSAPVIPRSHPIALADGAVAYIPPGAVLSQPKGPPLLVLLHGAGRPGMEMIDLFRTSADARGIVLLAPASRGLTWDSVALARDPPPADLPLLARQAGTFTASDDARRVEAAIAALGRTMPVDRSRTVLAGFSDGATFALAMGMARDHAFAAVLAFSPGIAIETVRPQRGRLVFVSHGRQDPVLPFAGTCAEIVPRLAAEGAAVTFLPFDGVHQVPPGVKDAFLDAVFGRVPGSQAVALPAHTPTCARDVPIGVPRDDNGRR